MQITVFLDTVAVVEDYYSQAAMVLVIPITFSEFGRTAQQTTAIYRCSRDFSKHLARRDFQGSLSPP